ncbi:MAG TPA: hypothetical protein VN848_10985 [Gemmatimonadales bacterium]|nr:hypothetical protein [Gemmatimonadales bacterium]
MPTYAQLDMERAIARDRAQAEREERLVAVLEKLEAVLAKLAARPTK